MSEPADERPAPAWMLLGLLLGILVLLSLGGESWRYALRYEREAVLGGEWWRLMTCHFVHGTSRHLLMNALAVLGIAALLPRDFSTRAWLAILGLSVLAVAAGLVLLEPQVDWYVGLSGVLHGALAAAAVVWWKTENRLMALALTAGLAIKLVWEQVFGALPLGHDLPVVVDAHLYGAIGGAIAGAALRLRAAGWSFEGRSL